MTRERYFLRLGYWCAILGITTPPALELVEADDIPGCNALTEWYRAIEDGWKIRIRQDLSEVDAEETLIHELLHVRTGCTDQCHEAWIRAVAAALAGLARQAQ